MDLRKLKTLIDLVQQSGIAELEITEGEEKVRISRGVPTGTCAGAAAGNGVCRCACRPQAPAADRQAANAGSSTAPRPRQPQGHIVNHPWSAPSTGRRRPDAKPFVELGDT